MHGIYTISFFDAFFQEKKSNMLLMVKKQSMCPQKILLTLLTVKHEGNLKQSTLMWKKFDNGEASYVCAIFGTFG